MAYTAVVVKKSVSKIGPNLFLITIGVTVNDGESDIFQVDASARYNGNAPNLDDTRAELISVIKAKWDKYSAEQSIFNVQAFDNMVSQIQTASNNYINQ